MWRNYLASALRNLARNKLYAGINIVGLSIGLSAAILIALFIRDELTYDRHFPDYERIYRLQADEGERHSDASPPEIAAVFKESFPQVEAVTRMASDMARFRRGDIDRGDVIMWVDPNFFDVLSMPVVAGDPRNALRSPDAMVITREVARRYFGRDDPLGETIEVNEGYSFRVAAVIENLPSNTHLWGKIFMPAHASFSLLARTDMSHAADQRNQWIAYTYFRLAPGATIAQVEAGLPDFIKRHTSSVASSRLGLTLRNIADIHLAPAGDKAIKPPGDWATIYAVCAIGLLIVFAASINFVNLMTARATRRAIEVGVRKAAGANRRDLIVQFTSESILYVAVSGVIAVALVELLTPAFGAFMYREITFDYWRDPWLLLGLLALVLVLGILAGSYPAFVLSAFRPAAALKSARLRLGAAHMVREALVIVQFAILIGLIFATAIIYRQTVFGMQASVRSDADEMMFVQGACGTAFADRVRELPGVRGTTCSDMLPFGAGFSPLDNRQSQQVRAKSGAMVDLQYHAVDRDYFQFYGTTARAGRLFSREHGGDVAPQDLDRNPSAREAIVINETAARALGFDSPQAAVGQTINWRRLRVPPADYTVEHGAEIIGVVADFPMGSVRQVIPPAVFYVEPLQLTKLNVKLAGDQIPVTVQAVERMWKEMNGQQPIFSFFLSRSLQFMYFDLHRQAYIVAIFASVALFIGCLGLFGLAAFAAERRTKEIGVRKALGAQTKDIMGLLVWQFMKPVLWANLIAWPVAAFLMRRWLEEFAYHIELDVWPFVGAAVAALLIAVVTVSGHCYLASRARPVTALRYE